MMSNSNHSVSVILPTYNEAKNIVPLVEAIQGQLAPMGLQYEVIVVDDNSPDGTAEAVRSRFAQDLTVRLTVRTAEHGLATAILCGLRQSQMDVVVVMDTDFNHDPAMLPQMIKFLEYYDVIIGSRFTMGGGMEDQARYYASFCYNLFLRLVLRTQVQDNLSGFFAMVRSKLFALDVDSIFHGYGEYFMRLLFLAWAAHLTLIEVPTYYVLRRHGTSKSHFGSMVIDYTRAALKLRFSGVGLPWTLGQRSFWFGEGKTKRGGPAAGI
jgi:dolichol-phosphate mannosyltransferase